MGEGEVRIDGAVHPGRQGLERAGLAPIELGAKEGLALINGTQVSTALALKGLFACRSTFVGALVAGAMSVDAAQGSDEPFTAVVQEVRGQPGQSAVAGLLRDLLAGSEIRASHVTCDRVQDPYSLRCQPQVMGSCLDLMGFAAGVLGREANAVTDNPLVFADKGDILSAGNFHAQPVAQAADVLALALAEIGSMSERRVQLLTNTAMSGLPAFLTPEPGLNSGFMAAQIAAAALAAENKVLAAPVSTGSLPTTADQEDHVSMATHAARRLGDMARNAATVVAIELLAAAQGLDLRKPLTTSPRLAEAHAAVRAVSPVLDTDRPLAGDIEAVAALVAGGGFEDMAGLDFAS
jgi:histidine ammonia-lyase